VCVCAGLCVSVLAFARAYVSVPLSVFLSVDITIRLRLICRGDWCGEAG
jgi:hypothetical protein